MPAMNKTPGSEFTPRSQMSVGRPGSGQMFSSNLRSQLRSGMTQAQANAMIAREAASDRANFAQHKMFLEQMQSGSRIDMRGMGANRLMNMFR